MFLISAIVDLSHPLDETTPVFPGDPGPQITVLETVREVRTDGRRSLNSSHIAIGMHCGTHMDAPFHFFDDKPTIDQAPLERFIGSSLLVDLRPLAARASIGVEPLAPFRAALERHKKVVIQTGWHERWKDSSYFKDHPVVSEEAAKFLVECGIHLIGIDTPSVDVPPFPAHLELLGNDVLIVENLTNLDAIEEEVFQLVVLPLKIRGGEASPARALAMPDQREPDFP
jgi:kynurenine formamidase